MESLLTRCPYCKSSFYKNVDEEREDSRIKVSCPYCNSVYEDTFDEKRVREHEFYWEIYSGLYPPVGKETDKSSRLTAGGIILLFALPFFLYGASLLLNPENVSNISAGQRNSFYGIGIAGGVFLLFVLSGIISAVKHYSFVVSLSGVIFTILSSVLWYYIIISLNVNMFQNFPQIFFIIPQFISVVSLVLFIRNRRSFKLGY